MNALSARAPWTRGVLMALWPLLLPLVWVTQIDSCEGHAPTSIDLTGIDVFAHLDLEGWLGFIACAVVMVATAPLAMRVARPAWRVGLHLLGLVASAFGLLLMSFLITFALFNARELRAAGLVVHVIFGLAVLDALLRVVWSIREWLRARVTSS